MSDNRSFLIGLRVSEVTGSAVCMGLHIKSYLLPNEHVDEHITIFCGTYMGCMLVSFSYLLVLLHEYRPPSLLQVLLGTLASSLYFTCSVLVMHFTLLDVHMSKLTEDEQIGHPFFLMSRVLAIASFLVGLLFTLDAVMCFDLWRWNRVRMNVPVDFLDMLIRSQQRRPVFLVPDEEELKEVELHCYCERFSRWCFGRTRSCRCKKPPEEDYDVGDNPSVPGLRAAADTLPLPEEQGSRPS